MKTRFLLFLLFLLFTFCVLAQAQTLTVLYTFGQVDYDGFQPDAGPTLDAYGNMYGTTSSGGPGGFGIVYEFKRNGTYSILFGFDGTSGGGFPDQPVVLGPNGLLFGNNAYGGDYGDGVVFDLQPPSTICGSISCPWHERVLHNNGEALDGRFNIAVDATGNIWGTTYGGGQYGDGSVFEMTPNGDGTYTYNVVYSFGGGSGGINPLFGPTLDSAGNVFVINNSDIQRTELCGSL